MVTCGAQATVPIVHAVSRVVDVPTPRSWPRSRRAPPRPARANIDEFTDTTARAQFADDRVSIFVQVEGRGDFLPSYRATGHPFTADQQNPSATGHFGHRRRVRGTFAREHRARPMSRPAARPVIWPG
jgi:acetaldehyde dehydrogenase (acetylating)